MSRSLNRLLRPKSIAVFGGKEAQAVVEQALKTGFDGNIWPVHPLKKEICGLMTYQSVSNLPGAPDAAYVAVNRHLTIEIIADLAKIGAGGAICYASGFREVDDTGDDLQQALVDAAEDMPIIGPNCYGLLNYADGISLWPDQHGAVKLPDGQNGVAIITQSSNIAINLTMQQRGLPLAYVLTAGNQAQTGLSELALYMLDDPRVTALGLHIEGFDCVKGIEAVARKARQLQKPVVAMKIGASEQAKAATFSHTASLSGRDAASNAFLKRLGIARVHSLPSLLETLKLLHVTGPLDGYSISSMSCSGGEAGLIADSAMRRKVYFRKMTQEEKQPVQQAAGPLVTISNPLDYHTFVWADRVAMEAVYTAMLSAGFDLNCLITDFPRTDRCTGKDWQISIDALAAASEKTGAKSCIISTLHENISEQQATELMQLGIAPLLGINEALDAIEAAADIADSWKRPESGPIAVLMPVTDQEHVVLDEAAGKKLLAGFGVPVPDGTSASTVKEAVTVAEKIGYPVAIKVLGIAHKSEQNAVWLNLIDAQALRQTAKKLRQLGGTLYVEAMVKNPIAELLVGLVRDPQLGLVMTIASGGIMVEILRDSQTLLLPFNDTDVEQALQNLKSAVLFDGFRGKEKADIKAAVKAILQIQEFALADDTTYGNQLNELDINPLMICGENSGQGAIAADVLIRFGSKDND